MQGFIFTDNNLFAQTLCLAIFTGIVKQQTLTRGNGVLEIKAARFDVIIVDCIALKFVRHLCSTAVETPVKF